MRVCGNLSCEPYRQRGVALEDIWGGNVSMLESFSMSSTETVYVGGESQWCAGSE